MPTRMNWPTGKGGGVTSYVALTDKPKINGTELNGNLSLKQLGIQNLPEGGTTGQALVKNSNDDYDFDWQDSSIPVTTAGISVTVDVGGYKKGDWIPKGTQLTPILSALLSPSEKPTLVAPSVAVSPNSGSFPQYAEVGDDIYVGGIKVVFNRGSITPPYGTDGYRAGNATLYRLKIGDEPEQTNASGEFSVNSITRPTKGSLVIRGTVDYAAGEQPKDSRGADYNSPLPAGSLSKSHTINFIQAFYYGAVGDDPITSFAGLTKDLTGKGEKTYRVTTAVQRPVFIYDAAYGRLSSIKDQNGFENINGFTVSTITVGGNQYLEYRYVNKTTDTNARYVLVF